MQVLLSIWFVGNVETVSFKTPIPYICWQERLKIKLVLLKLMWSWLVQIMACCPVGSKPLSELMHEWLKYISAIIRWHHRSGNISQNGWWEVATSQAIRRARLFFFRKLTMFWWNMTAIVLEISQPPKQSPIGDWSPVVHFTKYHSFVNKISWKLNFAQIKFLTHWLWNVAYDTKEFVNICSNFMVSY